MARTVALEHHLPPDELRQGYKTARTSADARRYHALWLISQGSTLKFAVALVGLSDQSVRLLVQRYNEHGPVGLTDRRATNPGKPTWVVNVSRLSSEYSSKRIKALVVDAFMATNVQPVKFHR